MKTHLTRYLLVLLAGASLAFAQNRVIPTDPGADTGNTGAAGAGSTASETSDVPVGGGSGTSQSTIDREARELREKTDRGLNNAERRMENAERRAENELDPAVGAGSSASGVGRAEQRFFDKVGRLNESEVMLSRQAAERASSPQVRSFATEMVKEHSQAGQELTSLATKKGAMMAPMEAREIQDKARNWADKKGLDYDRAYMKAMIGSHEETLESLREGAKSADPEVAAFSTQMLPKIQMHLERARTLEEALD